MSPSAIEVVNKCSTLSSVKKSLPSSPTDQSNSMDVPNTEKYNTVKEEEKNNSNIGSPTEPKPYDDQGNGNVSGIGIGNGEVEGDDDDDEDIDDDNNEDSGQSKDIAKRFLPAYKKPNAALTFPEKMMNLMNYATARVKQEKHFCVSWLPDGKAFVIYDIKDFTKDVVPKFFKASKFCSFTRKLYRWGFRQLNRGIGPDEPIIFGNEFFQQDNADLMVNMRSITAASIRKRESNLLRHMLASKKRALLSWNGGNAAASAAAAGVGPHELKQHEHELLLNSNLYGQQNVFGQPKIQHQNALAAAAAVTAGVVPAAVSQRFGLGGLGNGLNGGGLGGDNAHGITSTELSHMSNLQLQQLYRNCSTLPSADTMGMGPMVPDALKQMNGGGNLAHHNFGGVMPSCLPQDLTNASTQLSNITNGSFNNPINGSMFDINSDININGSSIGNNNGINGLNNINGHSLNGLGLNGISSNMNQNHSMFGASFPSNPAADLAMYGNNNMNRQGNNNFGYNIQQFNNLNNINLQQQLNNNNTSLATNDSTSMNNNNIGNISNNHNSMNNNFPGIDNNGITGTTTSNIDMNNTDAHQHQLLNQQISAAAAAGTGVGGSDELSSFYGQQQAH